MVSKAGGEYRKTGVWVHAATAHLRQGVYRAGVAQVMHPRAMMVPDMWDTALGQQFLEVFIYGIGADGRTVGLHKEKVPGRVQVFHRHTVAVGLVYGKHLREGLTKGNYAIIPGLRSPEVDQSFTHMRVFIPEG